MFRALGLTSGLVRQFRTINLNRTRIHVAPMRNYGGKGFQKKRGTSAALNEDADSRKCWSFRQAGVSKTIEDVLLSKFKIVEPIGIQAEAFKEIRSGQNIILGDATGNGKTLAFLIPIIQTISEHYASIRRNSFFVGVKPNSPQAIVVVPSKELASQVFEVALSLCRAQDFECQVGLAMGGTRRTPQKKVLNDGVDLLIATPGRLKEFMDDGHVNFSKTKFMVLDEADVQITDIKGDRSFSSVFKECHELIKKGMENSKKKCQFIFSSATFPRDVKAALQQEFQPKVLISNDFQRPKARLNLEHILTRGEDKLQLLMDVLIANEYNKKTSKADQTLIFCNTIKSCMAVSHFLTEHGVQNFGFHGNIESSDRTNNLDDYTKGAFNSKSRVLVTTDVVCRGLDFQHVNHVVLFDFPRNAVDFIHRIGRTARIDRKGKVSAILDKRELPLAEAIQKAHESGNTIDAVPPRPTPHEKGETDSSPSRSVKSRSAPLNSLSHGFKKPKQDLKKAINYRSFSKSKRSKSATPSSRPARKKPDGGSRPRSDFEGKRPRFNSEVKRPRSDFEGKRPRSDSEGKRPRSDFEGKRPRSDSEGKVVERRVNGRPKRKGRSERMKEKRQNGRKGSKIAGLRAENRRSTPRKYSRDSER